VTSSACPLALKSLRPREHPGPVYFCSTLKSQLKPPMLASSVRQQLPISEGRALRVNRPDNLEQREENFLCPSRSAAYKVTSNHRLSPCPPSFTWTCWTRTNCCPPLRSRRRTTMCVVHALIDPNAAIRRFVVKAASSLGRTSIAVLRSGRLSAWAALGHIAIARRRVTAHGVIHERRGHQSVRNGCAVRHRWRQRR
jgi:hypothetical protein